jgi:hypothetical protein
MTDFVEQCRQEWKRLGVPDSPADEMAADLETDLAEAGAEGVSVEELLGSSAHDPRSFAASWAAERGIIPVPPTRRTRRRPLVLVAFTAIAAVVLFGAALALATGNPKASIVQTGRPPAHLPGGLVRPTPSRQVLLSANLAAPVEWVLLFLAVVALGFAVWLWANWGRRPTSGLPA